MGVSTIYFKDSFQISIYFRANSAGPGEMPRFAAFYLPNYPFRGFQYTKGLMVIISIHVLTLGRQMFNPCDAEYYMYYTPPPFYPVNLQHSDS